MGEVERRRAPNIMAFVGGWERVAELGYSSMTPPVVAFQSEVEKHLDSYEEGSPEDFFKLRETILEMLTDYEEEAEQIDWSYSSAIGFIAGPVINELKKLRNTLSARELQRQGWQKNEFAHRSHGRLSKST